MQDNLLRESKRYITSQVEEFRKKEKQYEPIVKALKVQSDVQVKEKIPLNKPLLTKKPSFRPRANSTPGKTLMSEARQQPLPLEEYPEIFESETILPTPPASEEQRQNRSIRDFYEAENIGELAKKYLAVSNDRVFGIHYDYNDNKIAIGNQTITIENNDIILDNSMHRYVGTEGLWRLITLSENIQPYTEEDFENYKEILINTNAMYQNYDSSKNRPKSNIGWKWINLISNIWKEMRNRKSPVFSDFSSDSQSSRPPSAASQSSGKGLLIDTNKPIEYKVIGDFKDMSDRIKFIRAEEIAGNNSFNNEKLSIENWISDKSKELEEIKSLFSKNVAGGSIKKYDTDGWWLPQKIKTGFFI